jgi:putative YphP/YqiW family bacilliredoxin
MPYPEPMVAPMRAELSRLGVIELRDAAAVDAAFNTPGTMVLVVNSVCGCAAANARPAIGLATQAEHQPDQYVTVFAGQDMEATARARELMPGIPPSSPFIALLKDGDPVYVIERRHIEGRSASAIATDLVGALGAWCAEGAPGEGHPSSPAAMPGHGNGLPPTFRSIR